jgi:hypothetical protein
LARAILEDQFEDAGDGKQANDKDNGDNPQNNFHSSLPIGLNDGASFR